MTTEPLTLTHKDLMLLRAARDWLKQPCMRSDTRNYRPDQLQNCIQLMRGDVESARVLLELSIAHLDHIDTSEVTL